MPKTPTGAKRPADVIGNAVLIVFRAMALFAVGPLAPRGGGPR